MARSSDCKPERCRFESYHPHQFRSYIVFNRIAANKEIDERWDELETYTNNELEAEVKQMELIEERCNETIDNTSNFKDDMTQLRERSKALSEVLTAMMNRQGLNLQLSMNKDPEMKKNFIEGRKKFMPV